MFKIIDTTLREGEQSPGVNFSFDEKKKLIDSLCSIGIKEIEIGIASRLIDCPARLLEYCRAQYPQLSCSLWCRCRKEDLRHAATLNPDIIALSIPVSDLLITKKISKDRDWAITSMTKSIKFAHQLGIKAAIGFEDASRADRDFLVKMTRLAVKAGAFRIRLADTVGICSPLQISQLVKLCKNAAGDAEIGVHTHNDFGMASANGIAALENGATTVDVTVLGLGERTGCARLEEITGYLALTRGEKFETTAIRPLSNYVSALVKRPISPSRPIIGKGIFTCETGLHLQGLQIDPRTYEPYPPEKTGASRKLILGCKAGRKAITYHLKSMGYRINNDINDQKIITIRKLLASKGVTPEKLAELC